MRNWHASVSPVQLVRPQPIWAMLLIFSITCQHFQKKRAMWLLELPGYRLLELQVSEKQNA
jgi:hypothetical protein